MNALSLESPFLRSEIVSAEGSGPLEYEVLLFPPFDSRETLQRLREPFAIHCRSIEGIGKVVAVSGWDRLSGRSSASLRTGLIPKLRIRQTAKLSKPVTISPASLVWCLSPLTRKAVVKQIPHSHL